MNKFNSLVMETDQYYSLRNRGSASFFEKHWFSHNSHLIIDITQFPSLRSDPILTGPESQWKSTRNWARRIEMGRLGRLRIDLCRDSGLHVAYAIDLCWQLGRLGRLRIDLCRQLGTWLVKKLYGKFGATVPSISSDIQRYPARCTMVCRPHLVYC